MKLSVPLSDDVIQLSTLDQQAQRRYASVVLFFKLDHEGTSDSVFHHLKEGLAVTLSEVPDFASTVVTLPGSNRNELQLRLGPDSGASVKIVDYSTTQAASWSYGNYEELAAKKFPVVSIPPEMLFGPLPAAPGDTERGLPALFIQFSLIEGGFILGIRWHHTVCDARGMNVMIQSWARQTKTSMLQGTRGLPVMPSEESRERWQLSYGKRDTDIERLLLDDYVIDRAMRSPGSIASNTYQPQCHLLDPPEITNVPYRISVWYFSASALQSLRNALAIADTSSAAGLPENDPGAGGALGFTPVEAVSALVWKHLSIARRPQMQLPSLAERKQEGQPQQQNEEDSDVTSLFSTRLNYRARMRPPLAEDFIGNINEPNARARLPLAEVCTASTPQSLATLARHIRAATEEGSANSLLDNKAVRAFIGLVDTLPSVTDLTINWRKFPGPDLEFTDLSGLDTLRLDWGGRLGQPACMRLVSRETGLVYLLPLDRDGGLEVQVQCEPEAFDRLKADDLFAQYAALRYS